MRGVLAEADVGDDDERVAGARGFQGAEPLLDDAVVGIGSGGENIFLRGKAEEKQAAEAERGAGFGFFHGLIYR